MKEYNRTTKRWEEKSEAVGSLKKKETCRGGKPHDFILVLPDYLRQYYQIDVPLDAVEKYYESEDRIWECEEKEKKFKASIGITHGGRTTFKSGRYYECSVCYKKDYRN